MVRSVTWRTVAVTPTVVSGQQHFDRIEKVRVASCPDFDDRNACGGVRNEDREQPVASPVDEGFRTSRQIDNCRMTRGRNGEEFGFHGDRSYGRAGSMHCRPKFAIVVETLLDSPVEASAPGLRDDQSHPSVGLASGEAVPMVPVVVAAVAAHQAGLSSRSPFRERPNATQLA